MLRIIVHGGAGDIRSEEEVPVCVDACKNACSTGFSVLKNGKSSIDAVVAAVKVLEDHPLFDAGRGSYLNEKGNVEMDAGIMDGSTLNMGAVSAVTCVKNPAELARFVMEKSRHNFLTGEGAEAFAKEMAVQFEPLQYFLTERTVNLHEKTLFGDTVGAVALDEEGKIAVAVSTGGVPFKHLGRVGDSPLVGSGFYANDSFGAVATGIGEDIMRLVLSVRIGFYLGEMGLNKAVAQAIKDLDVINGKAGLIALDKTGDISLYRNTEGMFYAYMREDLKECVGGV
jgi:beta-aspartyl-peptidase (threonine type)